MKSSITQRVYLKKAFLTRKYLLITSVKNRIQKKNQILTRDIQKDIDNIKKLYNRKYLFLRPKYKPKQ